MIKKKQNSKIVNINLVKVILQSKPVQIGLALPFSQATGGIPTRLLG